MCNPVVNAIFYLAILISTMYMHTLCLGVPPLLADANSTGSSGSLVSPRPDFLPHREEDKDGKRNLDDALTGNSRSLMQGGSAKTVATSVLSLTRGESLARHSDTRRHSDADSLFQPYVTMRSCSIRAQAESVVSRNGDLSSPLTTSSDASKAANRRSAILTESVPSSFSSQCPPLPPRRMKSASASVEPEVFQFQTDCSSHIRSLCPVPNAGTRTPTIATESASQPKSTLSSSSQPPLPPIPRSRTRIPNCVSTSPHFQSEMPLSRRNSSGPVSTMFGPSYIQNLIGSDPAKGDGGATAGDGSSVNGCSGDGKSSSPQSSKDVPSHYDVPRRIKVSLCKHGSLDTNTSDSKQLPLTSSSPLPPNRRFSETPPTFSTASSSPVTAIKLHRRRSDIPPQCPMIRECAKPDEAVIPQNVCYISSPMSTIQDRTQPLCSTSSSLATNTKVITNPRYGVFGQGPVRQLQPPLESKPEALPKVPQRTYSASSYDVLPTNPTTKPRPNEVPSSLSHYQELTKGTLSGDSHYMTIPPTVPPSAAVSVVGDHQQASVDHKASTTAVQNMNSPNQAKDDKEMLLQSFLSDKEFSGCNVEICRYALMQEGYVVEKAKENIRVQLLLDMLLPNISEEDCRRALTHCQHKVDRAAGWLLQMSEQIGKGAH